MLGRRRGSGPADRRLYLRIGACTWLLQSGRIAQKYIPEALHRRGSAWSEKGEYDRAIEDYTQAIKLNPKYVSAHINRAVAYHYKGQYDRAIADYTQVIELKPKYVDAYFYRGISHGEKGQYDRAIADHDKAISLSPKYFYVYNHRGDAWDDKGEYDRAIEDYTAALRIEPDYAAALNGLAWLLATAPEARARDGQRAVRLAENAISLQDNAARRDTLAAAYAEAGRVTDAVSAQERAVAMARADGWAAADIADAKDRLRLYRAGRP